MQISFTGIRQNGNVVAIGFNQDLIDPIVVERANLWRVSIAERLESANFPVTLSGEGCNLVIQLADDGSSRFIHYTARCEAEAARAMQFLQECYRIPAAIA